ncbi:Histone deacetylase [Actinidia chinensis var. chinensis]|uniref:Histone deacetylase n=1 Tax=Actinidia chinensis var. chinensis TaxID=1590841 RepID=A0A2R6PQ64_ACTCC|nr:Histone deacetylase [Actinidia chinensis var. chinensis]
MEFWGVEVKAGESLKVTPDEGRVIHISQAALGKGKKEKGNDIMPLWVLINGEKFALGTLSVEQCRQVTFDLVFEKEFELSHDWKNGSVYFCGYSVDNPFAEDEDDFGSEDSDADEDNVFGITENGKIESKVEPKPVANKGKPAKPESSSKPKVTVVEPKKDESDDDESEDEDESDEAMMAASDDSDSESEDDSDEDDSESEDEETPKKAAEPSKKRPTESATKTPVPAKKAKLETPQKTDGKKGGGHTATPYPSKQAAKNPATSNKSKDQTPKSEGKVSCNSCNRTFISDKALESHSKAKHGATAK